MWDAAHQFERAAEHAVAEKARRAMLNAIGYEAEPVQQPPHPNFDEQLRYWFSSSVAPIIIWVSKACFVIFAIFLLSIGTYAGIWSLSMSGLEVQSRPIFFDYSPGESMMPIPIGIVDLRSTKSAPWVHYSCGDAVGDVCINNDKHISYNTEENDSDSTSSDRAILKKGQRYFIELTLTLPESEINKQLGIFMVKVDLRSGDRSLLASSKQHSMLPYESTMVSLFRKFMLMIPLASGLLSETRAVSLLCFDNYVDTNNTKTMSLVEISLGVPNPAAFPATLQTIQIHSAELRYGKEMNSIQIFLHNWRYCCAFFGTAVLFLGYALVVLSILNYRAQKSMWNVQPYADLFDSIDGSAQNSNSASHDRWMGADIEILEDDDNDSDAWEPIDSKEKKEENNENGNPSTKPAPNNPLVSDDESFSSKHNDAKGEKKTNTTFPLGKLADNATLKCLEPLFASKPNDESTHNKNGGSASKEKKTKQEEEEKFLADMVMKGESS